ncbi:hypothetical protein OROMI_003582 [Orobanche minor]
MLCSLIFSGGTELTDRYYGADCLISMPENPPTWFKNAYDDPCTNIGRGSNLTEGSHVECDARVMDGESGAFGAAGALPGPMHVCLDWLQPLLP